MIIGQKALVQKIDSLIDFPKFVIITGASGSGKHVLVHYVCRKYQLPIIEFGTGIDDVRKIIDLAYAQDKPVCYFCPNADNMSIGAKNALLKVTEEPPSNAYFIMTLLDIGNTLETIKSRATLFMLDEYTPEEIIEYRKYRDYGSYYDNIVSDICTTTGEVDGLFASDLPAFYKFAETVAFQIHLPVTGNIFKIPKSLKTTAEGNGYDPILLFKAVRKMYLKKGLEEKSVKYLKAAQVTTACLKDLRIPTVNKVGTVDKWIMDVRSVLRS